MPTHFNPIKTSVFDLFKIGPGPSSSHTIGPMKATRDFLHRMRELPADCHSPNNTIKVHLYGSLSATGRGHGTDRAVLAGLLDWVPEATDPISFATLWNTEKEYSVKISEEMKLSFEESAIIFDDIVTDYKFSNTMLCVYQHLGGELRMQYYSVGGGFIEWEGWELPETGEPPYPYSTFEGLLVQLKKSGLGIAELLLENEKAISGMTEKEIATKLDHTVNTMISAVNRGLVTIGTLPGSIQLKRKSNKVMEKAKSLNSRQDKFLRLLNAYCLAASEENAAGNIVVTAPTSGASGVIPGILYLMRHHYKIKKEKLREAMLVASCIGFLVKHNASISGAEAGCMGEVGTASGMGAAMIAYLKKEDIRTIEIAAEIAIEHHLGMTCDPVGGYVQIPCIERNAVGGVKAYNAWLLASSGVNDTQIISLDRVIRVVKETGKDMSKKYKETSEGGLALSMTEC